MMGGIRECGGDPDALNPTKEDSGMKTKVEFPVSVGLDDFDDIEELRAAISEAVADAWSDTVDYEHEPGGVFNLIGTDRSGREVLVKVLVEVEIRGGDL
jgi:hypothetical protein